MPALRDVPADGASPEALLAPAVVEATARTSPWVVQPAEEARLPLRWRYLAGERGTQRLEVGCGAVEDVENGATELGLEVVDRDVHRLAPTDCRRRFERRVRAGVVERRDEPDAVIGREWIAIQGRHGGGGVPCGTSCVRVGRS